MIKCIVSDLDGTLIDSLQDLANSCNAVLREDGFPVHSLDAYRYFVGNGIPKLIERILPEDKRTKERMADVQKRFDKYYQVHCLDATGPYPGIQELLTACREEKILLSVLSNKAEPFAKLICREIFGDGIFDAVCGQKPEVPKKPAPDGVFSLLRKF